MSSDGTTRNRLRWWLLAGVMAVGASLIAFVRASGKVEYAFRNPMTFLASLFTLALVILWFLIFCGVTWRTKLVTIFVGLVLVVGTGSVLQLDGFYGEMIPQFRWRWRPARDYELAEVAVDTADSDRTVLRAARTGDFPRFLGSQGHGEVSGVRLARDWSSRPPRQLWRHPIGAGWSAFSIAGEYAVTQEQRGESELVTCYEVLTGKLRWSHEDRVRFSETMGGDGPRATPTIADGRVYAMGATGILNCLDGGTGKIIWSRDVLGDHKQANLKWGKSCSPLVFDDIVVVTLGDSNEPSLAAYTGDAGRPLWQAGHDKASYATPVLATVADREQLLVVNQASLSAHDATYGDLLWEYAWPGEFAKCSQPVRVSDDRVFISAGYGIGSALIGVTPVGESFAVTEIWSNRMMKTRFTNVVIRDGHVYGLDDGILACLELATGRETWKAGRYGHGQLLLVDDLLLILSENGEIVLVEAEPTRHHELARFAALEGKTWNNPALAGRYLLVRNAQEAACYELPLDDASKHE